jgi:hypothetical protein
MSKSDGAGTVAGAEGPAPVSALAAAAVAGEGTARRKGELAADMEAVSRCETSLFLYVEWGLLNDLEYGGRVILFC